MGKNRGFYVMILLAMLFVAISAACGGSAPSGDTQPQASNADITAVSGSNAMSALGNGTDGLLLNQWADTNKVTISVQKLSGPEAKKLKEQTLASGDGPDVFVFDDGLYADGLFNTKSIAQSGVVLLIEQGVANNLGLTGNTISYDKFVELASSGQLATVAGNATQSTPSAEFFYSVSGMACLKSNSANLTIDMVNNQANRDCGKQVYDHIKTTSSTTDAINLVFDGIVNKQANTYNAVIAFDSSFLGQNGRNDQMIQKAGTFMKAFYFQEATPVTTVTFGTKDLSKDANKTQLVISLSDFLVGDVAQKGFNLAGLGNGSSAVATPDESAFKAEWGVTMYPSTIVNVVNPPVPAVAFDALDAYAKLYKRQKEIDMCIDTSGSTRKDVGNGMSRIQSIDNAIFTVTATAWQTTNGIIVGPNDRITYRFFGSTVTPILTESVGPSTDAAGQYINTLIGPASGDYNLDANSGIVNSKVPGFVLYGDTAMFDCAEAVRQDIESRYNSDMDYYILILTDGERTIGIDFDQFLDNWNHAGHGNISLHGIQFGQAGPDVSFDNVRQINGKHYDGTNAADLIQAFKDIFGS